MSLEEQATTPPNTTTNSKMVKKKGKSKRTTLGDKYKIQKRVKETGRKRKKQGRKDAAAGIVVAKKKDPGIPNSWPFKQDLLRDIQRQRERQQQQQQETKERRSKDLRMLRDHQAEGGTARSVQELMEAASKSQAAFAEKQPTEGMNTDTTDRSDGTQSAGQPSRRAYLRELKKVVDAADVILQVLDCRDPVGSRIHPTIENTILSQADKRMVLVLNKIDLVPKQVVGDWLTVLRRSHPCIAIKASQERGSADEVVSVDAASTSVPVGMDGLLQLLKNYARTGGSGGKSKTAITVGILGYPVSAYSVFHVAVAEEESYMVWVRFLGHFLPTFLLYFFVECWKEQYHQCSKAHPCCGSQCPTWIDCLDARSCLGSQCPTARLSWCRFQ